MAKSYPLCYQRQNVKTADCSIPVNDHAISWNFILFSDYRKVQLEEEVLLISKKKQGACKRASSWLGGCCMNQV
jgi:hypothetical protein